MLAWPKINLFLKLKKKKKKELATTWAIRERHSGWAIRGVSHDNPQLVCQYNKISKCRAVQAHGTACPRWGSGFLRPRGRTERIWVAAPATPLNTCAAPAVGAFPAYPTPPPRTHAAALPKWTLNGALASPTGELWLRPFGFWSREPGLRLVPGLWRLDPCHGLLSYHKVDTASLLELGHSGDTEDTRWGPHESWQHWAGTEGLPFPHGSHGEPAGRMLQEGPVSRGFSEGSKARWEGVGWEGVRCLGRTPRGLQSLTEHCAPYPSLAPGGPWCRRPTWPSAVTASTSASPRLWGHSEVQFL